MGIKLGKRIIADVFTLDFLREEKTVMSCDALSDAAIDIKVNETEVRAGQGNGLIATLHSGRDITVNATDVAFDFASLATNLGSTVVVGEGVAYMPRKVYTVVGSSTKKITLDKAPSDTAKLEIFDAKGKVLVLTTGYTISGETVSLVDSGIKENDEITVNAYAYKSNETAERVSITSDTYPGGGKLVLTTLEIDQDEKPIATIQFIFPNARPTGNINFNTASERNAMKTGLDFKVLKGSTSEIGYVIREEI